MELISLIFNTIFFAPIVNLLILIFKLLEVVHIPGALGLSIILLTILIRLLIWPLTGAQFKSAQKMSALKPHLDALKAKHQDDKMALQKAQMQLYKEHGINPTAGCLPTLIQFPIIIALYQVITNVFMSNGSAGVDKINSFLYHPWLHLSHQPGSNFFGINLVSKPSEFTQIGAWLLLVPLFTAVLTFVQSKMMMPAKSPSHHIGEKPKETKEKEGMEDAMASMQGQMVYLMPVMIGYFAFQFPVGLAIYWNTFTILGIIQQHRISGWGGLVGLLNRFGIRASGQKELTTKVTIERK